MNEDTLARFLSVPLLQWLNGLPSTGEDFPRIPVGFPPHVREAWRRCAEGYRLPLHISLGRACKEITPPRAKSVAAGSNQAANEDAPKPSLSKHAQASLIRMADAASGFLRNSGLILLLASGDGSVFYSNILGLPPYREMQAASAPGANWSEPVIGNNGLGTAIFLRQPSLFQGEEHYCAGLHKFTTAGYPLLAPDGSVLAVLAAITDRLEAAPLLSGLMRFCGRWMGELLLCEVMAEGSGWLVTMRRDGGTAGTDFFAASFCGLLTVDRDGLVRGVNESGVCLLGLRGPEEAIGQRLEALLGVGLYQLLGRATAAGAVSLGTPGGRSLRVEIKSRTKTEPAPPPGHGPGKKPSGGDEVTANLLPNLIALQERKIPILVTGESGVGKNYLVQRLHAEGPRKNGPLVTVNCAGIPRDLIQAELFGYEPGSFTGAYAKGRTGKVQAADKGVLFLNEIGDMPLDLQTSLLQLLDTSEATPIGRVNPVPIDIHVVATTNRSLKDEVRAGRFRLDLYYRLAGAEVELPPLRKREDKAWVMEAIFEAERGRLDCARERRLGEEVWKLFLNHSWPGNIRQFQHTVRLLLSGTKAPVIEIGDLPQHLLSEIDSHAASIPVADAAGGKPAPLADTQARARGKANPPLCEWELEAVRAALEQARGNVSEAAKRLGIARTTLYRKMERYGLKAR